MKLTTAEIIRKLGGETNYHEVGKKLSRLYRRIYQRKFYILDFNDPLKPTIVGRFYETSAQANQAIDSFMGGKHNVFIIFKGEDLRQFIKSFKLNSKVKKYIYPINSLTNQQRKSYRTKLRRHIRIMKARELNEWNFYARVDKAVIPPTMDKKQAKNYIALTRKKYYRTLA